MQRILRDLEEREFDLLVVGGGIYGAFIAWDAALRGLRVGLVEKADFGHATTANSMKTIHGGLRYLKDWNLGLIRTMHREREAFVRIAPHLVRRLPFVIPTTGAGLRSRAAFRFAFRALNLITQSGDRENGGSSFAAGRVVSREELYKLAPGISRSHATGAAVWTDAQVVNTERLLISILMSAYEYGAVVANYVEATSLLRSGDRVIGIQAQDRLGGGELEIRAKVVANAAGPWVDEVLRSASISGAGDKFHRSLAVNLVTRQIDNGYGVGFLDPDPQSTSREQRVHKGDVLFVVPWQDLSIIGTIHTSDSDELSDRSRHIAIDSLLERIRRVYPGVSLEKDDIRLIHEGYLPASSNHSGGLRLLRETRIHDHEREDGIHGLITVVGVKMTTSRIAAERVVDLTFEKLGRDAPACQTAWTPIAGGHRRPEDAVKEVEASLAERSTPDLVRELVTSYGTDVSKILHLCAEDPTMSKSISEQHSTTRVQLVQAARNEMARTLADVVLRRTSLGSTGHPGAECIQTSAAVMARELLWDERRIRSEIENLEHELSRRLPERVLA